MFKSAIRNTPRQALRLQNACLATPRSTRFLSTAPARKRGSWKGSALRWGAAAGAVYFYNTSDLFAEQPEAAIQRLDTSIHRIQDSEAPTLEAIEQERRLRREEIRRQEYAKQQALEGNAVPADSDRTVRESDGDEDGSLEGLEEEADQQGAFNPETGEINWDCPCLGGMAHGPCGEEFRAAFSCFVYSTDEPKGIECIDKFKGMQDCFRSHPEHYASELEEDEVEEEIEDQRANKLSEDGPSSASAESTPTTKSETKKDISTPQAPSDARSSTKPDTNGDGDEGGALVPRDVFDATASNEGK